MAPLLALAVAGTGAAPFGAEAASIADFAGAWRGVEVTGPEGGPLPFERLAPEDLSVTVVPDGDGFRMAWTQPGGERVEAAFAPARGRPGVFFVRPSSNPLLGLFFSPETGNPLKGERLLWSRLEGDTLVVYNLKLHEDGDFYLNRYAWTLEGDGADGVMTLEFSRLSEGLTEQAFTGRLQRAEG